MKKGVWKIFFIGRSPKASGSEAEASLRCEGSGAKPESERERSGGELGELALGEIGERERTAAKAIQLEEDS